jgi:hypothetical protein
MPPFGQVAPFEEAAFGTRLHGFLTSIFSCLLLFFVLSTACCCSPVPLLLKFLPAFA